MATVPHRIQNKLIHPLTWTAPCRYEEYALGLCLFMSNFFMIDMHYVEMTLAIDTEIQWLYYPPCSVDMNNMLSPDWISYFSSPSNSQSASLMTTRIPGRLCSRLAQYVERAFGAYIVSSCTKSSFLLSLRRLSQRYFMRKAMLTGDPESSLAGMVISCFFCSEKRISRPPLLTSQECGV
jgi:hypothetical protein